MTFGKQIFAQYRYFWIGVAISAIGIAIVLILGYTGWPGNPDICVARGGCFCEQQQLGSPIVEPINTWTNLFIVASGLLVLARLKVTPEHKTSDQANPLTGPTFYSVFYGFIGIAIGLGSTFYHASMTDWGGFLDVFAMNMLITFYITYDLARLRAWPVGRFLLLYIPLNVLSGVLIGVFADFSTEIFTILVAIAAVFEMAILYAIHRVPSFKWLYRNWKLFALGLGLFTFGTGIWLLSVSGAPLCDPTSWVQGHGFWHFFDGVAIYVLYLYFRSERVTTKVPEPHT